MVTLGAGRPAVGGDVRLDDCALDLLRERLRSATTEFHLQRTLHDLANHFHAIELRVTFLEAEQRANPDCPPVLREALQSCTSARERIDALKQESATAPAQPRRVALQPIIAQAAALALRDGGSVSATPELGSLPEVQGVEQELAIAFVHLFDNAREANGRVQLDGTADDEAVTLDISDDGSGIAEELRSRIWKPFFTTKDSQHHHGHGLALVQQILRRAGGSVQLQDRGPGASFALRLAR